MTQKFRISTALWAIAFLALGAAMLIWPDAVSGYTGNPETLLHKVIGWLWNRKIGMFLALLALLNVWSAFSKSPTKGAE
jgi:hypothetical protein